jgi:hypothetical protein
MKDRAKRDKEEIANLLKKKHELYHDLQLKDQICRKLIELIKKENGDALDGELMEILMDDHLLRKQI